MKIRREPPKFQALISRLIGVGLVLCALFISGAAVASQGPTHADAPDTVAAESNCDEKCPSESVEDLCPDDCPDCTHCHSVAPSLLSRATSLNINPLPHSRDALPYASIMPSSIGQRLFKPPRRA